MYDERINIGLVRYDFFMDIFFISVKFNSSGKLEFKF